MKTKFGKYFIMIWLVVIAVYNATLFLLVNQFSKNFLTNGNFWVIYGCMMFAFILWFIIGILDKNTKFGGLSPMSIFIYPYIVVIFIMTTIMFFFTNKIILIAIILPMILITGILAILTIFARMNKKQIENNPQRIPDIFNVENLEEYFKNLANLSKNLENELLDLAIECEGLTTVQKNEDIANLDTRLFEYAAFIKQNALRNEDLNIYNNIKRFKDLLQEREALIAKLDK